jgi:integral membrane sensor domain MASE1
MKTLKIELRRIFWQRCAPAYLATIAVLLGCVSSAEACPMCKAALGSGADRFMNAWGLSIVFLLSMPFTLFGAFSIYMYVLVRRARAEQAAKQAGLPLAVEEGRGDSSP